MVILTEGMLTEGEGKVPVLATVGEIKYFCQQKTPLPLVSHMNIGEKEHIY